MRYAGELCAVGTALSWAIGSNFFAGAGRRMGSAILNRLRIAVALVLLSAVLAVTRGAAWPVWATPAQTGLLALSGIIGFVFGDTWFFRSLVILGPSRATLLASLAPLFTTALAWPTLHEHPGPLALLGMALILAGIAWVLHARGGWDDQHPEGSVARGVMAGVLGAIGQAGGYVLSKSAMRSGLDPLSATVIRMGAAVLAIWLLTVFERQVRPTLGALRDRAGAGFMVGGAIFGPFLGATLSLAALHYIDSGVAASIIAFYPVVATLIASRAHHEPLSLKLLAGALIAVVGVVVLFLR